MDLKSVGAVGQSDVRQFFDSNNMLRVFSFLCRNGLPHALAAACIRHQMLPQIMLKLGDDLVNIGSRSIGSLTGSGFAGKAARVLIQHACCVREPYWRFYGFDTPTGCLTMSTFVDNLFVAGRACNAVSKIFDDAEEFLNTEWGLRIKPSSRLILAPRGAADVSVSDAQKWPVVESMKVLGHILQHDGGVDNVGEHFLEIALPRDHDIFRRNIGFLCLRELLSPSYAFAGQDGRSWCLGHHSWTLSRGTCLL